MVGIRSFPIGFRPIFRGEPLVSGRVHHPANLQTLTNQQPTTPTRFFHRRSPSSRQGSPCYQVPPTGDMDAVSRGIHTWKVGTFQA